jgi:hypothetical protein
MLPTNGPSSSTRSQAWAAWTQPVEDTRDPNNGVPRSDLEVPVPFDAAARFIADPIMVEFCLKHPFSIKWGIRPLRRVAGTQVRRVKG